MREARNEATTPIPNTLPPVIVLGRSVGAAVAEYVRLDRESVRSKTTAREAAMRMLLLRQDGLRDLIAKLPAETLEDAAVQLGVAFSQAARLHFGDWSEPAQQPRLGELHAAVYRITLSVLPIVATAAGLDLAAMGYEEVAHLRARAFGSEAAR